MIPESPLLSSELIHQLAERLAEISSWESEQGSLRVVYPVTSPLAGLISALVPFIERNSNNIGAHFRDAQSLRGTKRLEREALNAIAKLLHDPSAEGWITSGGTEGNLTGLWLAREYLRQLGCKRLAVLLTRLSHDSVYKACRILDMHDLIVVPLEVSGTMSPQGLREGLLEAKNIGVDGVVVVATVGATETGTCDAVDQLAGVLRDNNHFPFYFHVDAAFAGLVLPFSNPERAFDFRVPEVHSICVDLHKMGGTPIGSGVFLCRTRLSEHIRQASQYAHVYDVTVLGSRPGFAAAAAWYALFSQGRKGFESQIIHCLARKNQFIQSLRSAGLQLDLIHDEAINVAAVHFCDLPKGHLPMAVSQSLRLSPSPLGNIIDGLEQRDALFYRFFFMPHLSVTTVELLANKIVTAIKEIKNQ